MFRRFKSLLTHWRNRAASPSVREMRVQAGLLDILSSLRSTESKAYETDPSARLWWMLEMELRRDLSQPVDLATMQRLTRRSPATIARSCVRAVDMPPMKRIKQIRMSFARGLVQHSDLTMSEIAQRIGYSRVHELSRDYHRHHGLPPTQDRKAAE
jgi:transcriptional regulator GlxA family with amidase domain